MVDAERSGGRTSSSQGASQYDRRELCDRSRDLRGYAAEKGDGGDVAGAVIVSAAGVVQQCIRSKKVIPLAFTHRPSVYRSSVPKCWFQATPLCKKFSFRSSEKQ